jgi:protein-tyrosine kinase
MSRIENALEKASSMQTRVQRVSETAVAVEPERFAEARSVGPRNPGIVTLTQPDSPAAEEYRKLRTALLRGPLQSTRQPAVMVTSAVSGEGKSLTAVNLAVSLAEETDRSVLLIDADMRRPSLAEYLGLDAPTGLADCLRDGTPAASAVVGTGIPRLALLPAGKASRNPVEALSSPGMRSLIAELKRSASARTLIIDTPPALPFAETPVIGSMADGIVIVVREGTTTVEDLQETLRLVGETKVLGVVLNDMSEWPRNDRYQHYYRYYAARRRENA